MKKLALFLCMTLLLGCMLPFAASAANIPVESEILNENPQRTVGVGCYELLSNRSFELLQDETHLTTWGFTSHIGMAYTWLGCGFVDRSTDAHTGEYALRVFPGKAGERCDSLCEVNIIEGETYEFSIWFKRLADGGDAQVYIRVSGQDKGIQQSYQLVKLAFNDVKVSDGWVQKTIRFKAPQYAKRVAVSLRFWGPGDVLWDDASLLCIGERPKAEMSDVKSSIKDMEIKNADFENENLAEDWEVIGPVKSSTEYAHAGERSVELRNGGSDADTIVTCYVTGLEKGATYQVTGWLLNPEAESVDMGFWLAYFATDKVSEMNEVTQRGEDKSARWGVHYSTEWQQYVAEFTPPDDAKSVRIRFRHRLTPGVVYLDDVAISMVKPPNVLNINTDETFYYSEWETGECKGIPYVIEDPRNTRAEFSFVELDGTETHKETIKGLTGEVKYVFRTEWMKEMGKRYHISLKVYGPDNSLLQEELFPIYRYDRPTYMGADGIFRKNGDEIIPIFGTGTAVDQLDEHPEKGGITVLSFNGLNNHPTLTQEQIMDKALEQGMYVMLICFSGRMSAGHPDMIDSVIRGVERIKDHPALFGYKLCDEPYQKGISEEEMIAGYTAIRDIDPHHPVYLDDSPPGGYEWMFRYCDFLDVDYYGGGSANAGTLFTDVWDSVREASKGRKPFTILQQASMYSGYIPSFDELRHQVYQVLFSGGFGYGYHVLGAEHSHLGEPAFMDREQWTELVEKWAPWELDFAMGCFVTGEYKFVNYGKSDDVLWGTFTDGTDLYAIVLNRKKTESTPANIPLSDGMGMMKIGAFVASRKTGESARVSGIDTLSFTLAPLEAVVWKITPTDHVLDASHLKDTTFNDIIYYPWAYNAIATLEEKGIVNRVSDTWYGPQFNITRGDYAMFLVRTLGLTEAPGENFVDVDPTAEYAKELAVGKAAGIINGIGDNKFNPEAQITRQDMMTMTSRALKLAGAADLSAFADSGIIADYAQSHVAAMVAEGLIKGNADGTINPLGNTTRAEAAVIMQRLLNK
ncbi:MAG: S-layer homology domain-containing protein [Clostridia bacterium]|nr:S-layer homology domain-containing protein [Clostridia bacterium]